MPKFSDEVVMNTLREVVAENPDFVYDASTGQGICVYSVEGAPSCLVGHVVSRLDGDLFNEMSQESLNDEPFGDLGFLDNDYISQPVEQALMVAQEAQDSGSTWGGALAAAEETYTEESANTQD